MKKDKIKLIGYDNIKFDDLIYDYTYSKNRNDFNNGIEGIRALIRSFKKDGFLSCLYKIKPSNYDYCYLFSIQIDLSSKKDKEMDWTISCFKLSNKGYKECLDLIVINNVFYILSDDYFGKDQKIILKTPFFSVTVTSYENKKRQYKPGYIEIMDKVLPLNYYYPYDDNGNILNPVDHPEIINYYNYYELKSLPVFVEVLFTDVFVISFMHRIDNDYTFVTLGFRDINFSIIDYTRLDNISYSDNASFVEYRDNICYIYVDTEYEFDTFKCRDGFGNNYIVQKIY